MFVSAESGLPSIDPEVKDTVNQNENVVNRRRKSAASLGVEGTRLISSKRCVREGDALFDRLIGPDRYCTASVSGD